MNAIKTFINENFKAQPSGFFVILYTEICELFGRFAIMSLLILYLTSDMKLADNSAFAIYGALMALIFIIPLLGGFYSDRFMGYKPAIITGISLMALGNITIAYPNVHSLYVGLALIAVGSGFFTPSLTALLGKLYHRKEQNRDNAFVMYYISKNVGALLATVFCSMIGQAYGYSYAFLLSAIVMVSGLVVFSIGSKKLTTVLQCCNESLRPKSFLPSIKLSHISLILVLIAATCAILTNHITEYLFIFSIIAAVIVFGKLYLQSHHDTRKNLRHIFVALAVMTLFSMLLGQGGTTLNLFIERIINRNIGGYTIPPSMFYALDPLFMLLFGAVVMHLLRKMHNSNPTISSFNKLSLGLIVLAIGFAVFVLASQFALSTGHKPSVLFVFAGYMIFPIAELAIMPITVSLVTRLAPQGKDALMVSFYFLGQGIASYLTGSFSKLGTVNFPVKGQANLLHAASIYQYVFFVSATLLVVGAVATYGYRRLCVAKTEANTVGVATAA